MKRYPRLKNLRVASPCPVSWADMQGDDKVRYCNCCSLNVYNVSAMTREEAEDLLFSANGRLCVRFYRRADGRVMTQDCPVGLEKLRRRMVGYAATLASCILGVLMLPMRARETSDRVIADPGPVVQKSANTKPTPKQTTAGMPIMGDVAAWPDNVPVMGRTNPELGESHALGKARHDDTIGFQGYADTR